MAGREGEGLVTDQRLVRVHGIPEVFSEVREGVKCGLFLGILGFYSEVREG